MTTVTIPSGSNIDDYLKAHRTDTRFVLSAGLYYTDGLFAFANLDYTMLGRECELIGAGSADTKILARDTLVPPDGAQLECLTAGSRSGMCNRVVIQGVSITALPSERTQLELGIVGLHVWSDACTIRDVRVSGITGTRPSGPGEPSREGFGVLVNRSGVPFNAGQADVADVFVHVTKDNRKAEHYLCGLYVGYEDPVLTSSVRRVTVVNGSAVPAHAAFGVNGRVIGREWSNVGRWNRAIFCDTGSGTGTIIDSSILVAERVAMEFRGGAGAVWRDIVLRDSQIRLTPPDDATYAAGLVLVDETPAKAGATFDGVVIENCCLRAVPSTNPKAKKPQDFYLGSLDAANAANCGLYQHRTRGSVKWLPPQITNASPPSAFAP